MREFEEAVIQAAQEWRLARQAVIVKANEGREIAGDMAILAGAENRLSAAVFALRHAQRAGDQPNMI